MLPDYQLHVLFLSEIIPSPKYVHKPKLGTQNLLETIAPHVVLSVKHTYEAHQNRTNASAKFAVV